MPDPVAVNSMFGRIARRYDLANRMMTGGLDLHWRRRLVASVRRAAPSAVLDLATGSGDVAFALSRELPAAQILGIDFCAPMLAEAEQKKAAAGPAASPNLRFVLADALALPLPDNSFDAITISFGLRNMEDRHRSLIEMRRVLKPGGRLFVLEFSQPQRWLRPAYFFYLRHILPVAAGWLTGDRSAYQYLNRTIEEFPGRRALEAELLAVGFCAATSQPLSFGIVACHEAVT